MYARLWFVVGIFSLWREEEGRRIFLRESGEVGGNTLPENVRNI